MRWRRNGGCNVCWSLLIEIFVSVFYFYISPCLHYNGQYLYFCIIKSAKVLMFHTTTIKKDIRLISFLLFASILLWKFYTMNKVFCWCLAFFYLYIVAAFSLLQKLVHLLSCVKIWPIFMKVTRNFIHLIYFILFTKAIFTQKIFLFCIVARFFQLYRWSAVVKCVLVCVTFYLNNVLHPTNVYLVWVSSQYILQ